MRPQLVDYNHDGRNDLIAGSYTGDLYVSLGSEEGFAEWTQLTDVNGQAVVLGYFCPGYQYVYPDPSQFAEELDSQYRSECAKSFTVFDWDQDGDLDLLIGSDGGTVFLRRNIGTRSAPLYAAHNEVPLTANGQLLSVQVPFAVPEIGDVDGDGLLDLVIGVNNGGAYWFRNTSTETVGDVQLEPAEVLLPPCLAMGKMLERSLFSASVDLIDLNEDGKLDLVVGDGEGDVWFYRRR